jgi:hypothetical protein
LPRSVTGDTNDLVVHVRSALALEALLIVSCAENICKPERYEESAADPRIRIAVYAETLVTAGAEGLLQVHLGQDPADNIRPTGTSGEFLGLSANYTAAELPNSWAAVGRAGLIRYSGDGGETWTAPAGATTDRDLFAVAFSCVAPDVGLAVGDGGVILRTTDGGREWVPSPSPSTETLRSVVITWRSVAIAVGDRGTLLRSADAGETWEKIDSGTTEDLHGASAHAPCQWQLNDPDDRRALAVGDRGTILVSEDAGATWTLADSDVTDDFRQVALFPPDEVYFRSAVILGERTLWRWDGEELTVTSKGEFPDRPETMILGAYPTQVGVIGGGTLRRLRPAECYGID